LKKKVILAFIVMVAVILVLAFSNKLVENTPDFQEAKPSSSTEVEQPTPSTENAPEPSDDNSSATDAESENLVSIENSSISKLEKSFTLTDTSMEPTIKNGATIVYMPVPFESLRIDDVIIFKEPNHISRIAVARITGIDPNGLATKGDHNLVPNPYDVTAPFLLGKVTQINNP
jgi:hypothetical protein